MPVPGETVDASATLVIVRLGQFTVITTLPEEPGPPFVLLKEAEFVTVGQVANVVGDVMCTVVELPDAIVVDGQVNDPAAIVHPAPAQPDWLAIVQVSPVFVGSVSLRVTPVAFPGPALETVMT
jgi:hypothetical protein